MSDAESSGRSEGTGGGDGGDDRRFGADPLAFFCGIYEGAAPWDIGRAQPAILELLDEYPPEPPVLDVGCGTGDLAITLARRRVPVLGLDFAPAAIDQARQRAAAEFGQGAGPAFEVGDALQLSQLDRRFGSIVDTGFLHVLETDQRDRFVDQLLSTLVVGGRYYLLAFAIEFDLPNTPLKVTPEEVRRRFSVDAGWRILALRDAQFLSVMAPVPALAACIQRI